MSPADQERFMVLVREANKRAQELLKEFSGDGEFVCSDQLIKMSLLAKMIPALFLEYRNHILLNNEQAMKFHRHLDNLEIIAFKAPVGTPLVSYQKVAGST